MVTRFLIFTFVILLFLFTVMLVSTFADDDACKKGMDAFEQDMFDQAINNLGQCLETATLSKQEKVNICKTLGFCYLAFDITWQAKKFISQALELDPAFDPSSDPVWGHKVAGIIDDMKQNAAPGESQDQQQEKTNPEPEKPAIEKEEASVKPGMQQVDEYLSIAKNESNAPMKPLPANQILVSIGNLKRFSISECGTIIDNIAGLEWLADPGSDVNYAEASEYAYTLKYCGHSDWRLPTRDELVNLKTFSKVPCYGSNCQGRGSFKIDPVFRLGGCCPWSMETQSESHVWGFDFSRGSEFWLPSHYRLNSRVLVVRKRK